MHSIVNMLTRMKNNPNKQLTIIHSNSKIIEKMLTSIIFSLLLASKKTSELSITAQNDTDSQICSVSIFYRYWLMGLNFDYTFCRHQSKTNR